MLTQYVYAAPGSGKPPQTAYYLDLHGRSSVFAFLFFFFFFRTRMLWTRYFKTRESQHFQTWYDSKGSVLEPY